MLIPVHQNPDVAGPLGWSSCSCACTAMLISMETGGTKRPTAGDVRSWVRNADGSLDIRGGTTPAQNVDAAQRGFRVELDYRVMPFEDAWRLGQRTDVALSISISYAVIANTQFDGSPGFRGLHQIVLSGGLVYDPLADGRRPGIPTAPDKWPKDLLRRAAGKYSNVGEGRAAVIVGRAPVVKPSRYSVAFNPGAIYVYPKGGGRIRDAFGKATSARCTAPFLIPWLTGKKRVVEVTAGRLTGMRVEPGATHVALLEGK